MSMAGVFTGGCHLFTGAQNTGISRFWVTYFAKRRIHWGMSLGARGLGPREGVVGDLGGWLTVECKASPGQPHQSTPLPSSPPPAPHLPPPWFRTILRSKPWCFLFSKMLMHLTS